MTWVFLERSSIQPPEPAQVFEMSNVAHLSEYSPQAGWSGLEPETTDAQRRRQRWGKASVEVRGQEMAARLCYVPVWSAARTAAKTDSAAGTHRSNCPSLASKADRDPRTCSRTHNAKTLLTKSKKKNSFDWQHKNTYTEGIFTYIETRLNSRKPLRRV